MTLSAHLSRVWFRICCVWYPKRLDTLCLHFYARGYTDGLAAAEPARPVIAPPPAVFDLWAGALNQRPGAWGRVQ